MALPFKAPKFLNGKTFGINNSLVYPAVAAALIGGGYLLTGGKIPNLFPPAAPSKALSKAVRVNFNVYPPTIKPFRKIRLQGQFEDANGIPAPVEYGYYSIFESVPAGADFRAGRLLISSGIVGQNVGAFRIDVPTDNLRTGPYSVYVSNRPIQKDPLAGNQAALQLMGGRSIAIG